MQNRYDWIVVGAGLSGSVVARQLAENELGTILVVEQRDHVAGNTYDYVSENGQRIHKFGPHIFHTNSEKVFKYLSRFTDWFPYEHRVVGQLADGNIVPIPFNLDTLRILEKRLFEEAQNVLRDMSLLGSEIPVMKLMGSSNQTLRSIGEVAYESLFRGYSEKQWGEPLENLSPSVGARVPVRFDTDDRYFRDKYQVMPRNGYEFMVKNILNHKMISVSLETSFDKEIHLAKKGVVYSGAIDQLNDYNLGHLPYRSLEFKLEHHDRDSYQVASQVNYTQTKSYTRITEFKHFTGLPGQGTTIAKEYPQIHVPGVTIPYYPIPKDQNSFLHEKYVALTSRNYPKLIPIGRLADYKYYNMDQVVARALQLSATLVDSD